MPQKTKNCECECTEPGFCVRYNRPMSERMHQICQGRVLTPRKCAVYREIWLRQRETGAGDVVHSVAKATGLDKAANVVSKTFGKDCGCAERRKNLNRKTVNVSPFRFDRKNSPVPRFITTRQLADDTLRLVEMLPPDVTRIAGVSRSGLTVAALLAKFLHLPLDIIRPQTKDIVDASHGWRLSKTRKKEGVTVVVDDTMMTGNSLRKVMPLAEAHYENPQFAVVYYNPHAKEAPCYYVHELYWPHLLEWNLFNSVLTPGSAFDMDGVLCEECPPGDNDDGRRYAKFLSEAKPKYLVRKTKIPLIVTARHEKYRNETMVWLDQWGIQVGKLVMRAQEIPAKNWVSGVSAIKAQAFQEFLKRRVSPGPQLFIESCPLQARTIAKLSGGLVVCPTNGECFLP